MGVCASAVMCPGLMSPLEELQRKENGRKERGKVLAGAGTRAAAFAPLLYQASSERAGGGGGGAGARRFSFRMLHHSFTSHGGVHCLIIILALSSPRY